MSKSKQSQNVLILGLTGPPGLQLVGEAIAANWNITLFVRSPEKLTQDIKDSPNVNAIPALPKAQRPYVIALSTPSQDAPQDTWPWAMSLMISLFSRVLPGAYNEIQGINAAFQMYGKEVTWTHYRVGNLTDEKEKGIATAG